MTQLLFKNANILDPIQGKLLADHYVLVEDGIIREVSNESLKTTDAQTFDLRGKTLMPGLCDGHVHVSAIVTDYAALRHMAPSYIAVHTSEILHGMLMRGFTTVRDAGGTDFGIADAVEEGSIIGPRIRFSGRALSQTGGHGDFRLRGNTVDDCHCCAGLGRICDGVTEVRRACRDEIRKGAHQIKVMASGGVVSPTDRITSTQFSREELTAAVEEAQAANIYVMAHAYTATAINRALECGIRSIEHGNLLDQSSIDLFLKKSAFLVPTLSVHRSSWEEGLQIGMQKSIHAKIAAVLEGGMRALELAHKNNVKMVYGTDLMGSLHRYQLREFALRGEVQKPIDVIRAATTNAAELFQMQGEIGIIAPNARADLLVIDGNPLEDLGVMQNPEKYLKLITKDGKIFKDELSSP